MNGKQIAVLTALVILAGAAMFSWQSRRTADAADVEPVPVSEKDNVAVNPADYAAATEASNGFAFRLYDLLRAEPGNVFVSPYSITTALAMVGEGARGETAEQIETTFGLPVDPTVRRSAFSALHTALNPNEAPYELAVANALWAQQDYPFLPEYVETLQRDYGAEANNMDFANAAEEARQTINAWVEEQTNDRIQELFEAGTLHGLTRLVLTNAIYFKGTWAQQFDPENTRDEDFHAPEGTVTAPLMSLLDRDSKFGYAEQEGLQALELPYEGDDLSMYVLLPEAGGLEELEAQLTPAWLADLQDKMYRQPVFVHLPRFTFEAKYELNEPLGALGMPNAFMADVADFSGMDGTRGLYIDLVVHQSFVEVNEEGTEAATATGVSMRVTSMPAPPPTFRADRPFLFLIQHRASGMVLFLGRMVDPTAG